MTQYNPGAHAFIDGGGAGAPGPPGPPGPAGPAGPAGPNGSRLVAIKILAPGTLFYTPPAGINQIVAHVIGAGGGGGGARIATPGARAMGGGGASGAYAFRLCAVTPLVPIPCVVGASGLGGVPAAGNGGTGGDTSIGPFPIGGFTILAPGGPGGGGFLSSSAENIAPGGKPATPASGGTYNGYGSNGQPGLRVDGGTEAIGGAGAVGPFGSGGSAGWVGAVPTTSAGGDGGSPSIGSGGGGGTQIGGVALSGAGGGPGDQGGIVIYEYNDAAATLSADRFLVFNPAGVPGGNVYTTWPTLSAALAALPLGEQPQVSIVGVAGVPTTFTVPLLGMPIGGWPMNGANLISLYPPSGDLILDLPAGVQLDNLAQIDNGLRLEIAPPVNTAALNFTNFNPAGPWSFFLGRGCTIYNSGAGALMRSTGGGTLQLVFIALPGSAQGAFFNPPSIGPLLELLPTDFAVSAQLDTLGGMPAGWITGDATTGVLAIIDSTGTTPAEWGAGFAGTGTTFLQDRAIVIAYSAATPADWTFPPPVTVAEALDRLAAVAASPP